MTFLCRFIFTRKDCRIKWVPLWEICCQATVIFILVMGSEGEDSVDWVRVAHWGAGWQLLQKTWVTPFFFFLVEGVGREEMRDQGLSVIWDDLKVAVPEDSPGFPTVRSLPLGSQVFPFSLLNVTFSFQLETFRRSTDSVNCWKSLLLPMLRTGLGSVPCRLGYGGSSALWFNLVCLCILLLMLYKPYLALFSALINIRFVGETPSKRKIPRQ